MYVDIGKTKLMRNIFVSSSMIKELNQLIIAPIDSTSYQNIGSAEGIVKKIQQYN